MPRVRPPDCEVVTKKFPKSVTPILTKGSLNLSSLGSGMSETLVRFPLKMLIENSPVGSKSSKILLEVKTNSLKLNKNFFKMLENKWRSEVESSISAQAC